METQTKTFDCVQMKRRGAARVRSETEGMTRAQRLAYWEKGTKELLAEQKALREATAQSSSHNETDGD